MSNSNDGPLPAIYVAARLFEARAILADPSTGSSLRALAELVIGRWGRS